MKKPWKTLKLKTSAWINILLSPTKIFPIAIFYILMLINLLIFMGRFIWSLYWLDYSLMATAFFYRVCMLLFPPILWMIGTCADYFNYYRMKKYTFFLMVLNEALLVVSLAFQLLSTLLLPSIISIKVDDVFTKGMLLLLARIATELPLLLLTYYLLKLFLHPLRDKDSCKAIMSFRLSHFLDIRGSSYADKIVYNLTIVKKADTGKQVIVSELDRYLHTLVDGTSGTGKTSSTILPAIRDDLNMRLKAEKIQKSQIKSLLEQGAIASTDENALFSINNYVPSSVTCDKGTSGADTAHQEDIQQQLERIRLDYAVCGITVLAPDDSLTDDVCRLCEARGIPYHRIDATRTEQGQPKSSLTGMNPFFLPARLSGEAQHQLIIKKAVIFADVMQAITDLKGSADSYFTNLNRQLIANLAILVMHTVPVLYKRQATPADLQSLINNFDLLPEYVNAMEVLDQHSHRYNFILQYIRDDLLGKGRVKMDDQSRGTRNIINEFLLMPGSREIFCSQDSLDFDRALQNGEITVCNYDLASGDTNAVAFGLFFLLSFNNSVLSRPGNEKTRIPHFFYIDELPVLIHSSLEKNFSLFRKYRVAMFSAIQTIEQFDKNQLTMYLKGVVLGCAHIIAFGRSSLSDMKVFSAMAGVRDEVEEQTAISETALSGDSPVLSYSSREMATQKNALEEIDIRMQDFQEVTFFTVREGRPLPPIKGRVEFLKKRDWEPSDTFPQPFWAAAHAHGEEPVTKKEPAMNTFLNSYPISHYTISETDILTGLETIPHTQPQEQADTYPAEALPEGSESIGDLF